jgi:hypothetical protein
VAQRASRAANARRRRTRADRDLVFVHRAMGAILDPTSDPVDNILTKIGVDATKPGGADFAQRLTIADEQRARVRHILSAARQDLTGANTAKIAFLPPDRPVFVKKYNAGSVGWMRNSLLGGSTEFFERSTNFDGPNNRIAIE